jgi:hypothetical protein
VSRSTPPERRRVVVAAMVMRISGEKARGLTSHMMPESGGIGQEQRRKHEGTKK